MSYNEPEYTELPPAPPAHIVGTGYSSHNPVPTTQKYHDKKKEFDAQAVEFAQQKDAVAARKAQEVKKVDTLDQKTHGDDEKSDGYGGQTLPAATAGTTTDSGEIDHSDIPLNNAARNAPDSKPSAGGVPKSTGQQEKAEMMDRMNANQQKPIDRVNKGPKGERRVRDPVTGKDVIIKDADPKEFDMSTPSLKGSNILLHPFPPAVPPSLTTIENKLTMLGFACGGGLFLVWIFTAIGHGLWRFVRSSLVCGAVGTGLVVLVSLISRGLEKEMERVRVDLHRSRGETYSPPVPESVEWLNNLIKLLWGVVNPSMFIGIADMIEDIMQQSLPGFVDAVKISDLGQGTNPLRILSIRALADQPGDQGYPKVGWINKGEKDVKTKDTAGKDLKEDEAGEYYNFEVAFAYQALPGQAQHLRSKNIHLLLEFFLGVYDWLHIPIPIWIQVESIYGVVRLRVQFIQEAPFVRNLTFTLCGVPSVEISAIPMSKHLPNILDLPFISYFVKMAIAAGTSTLCAPQSMTLNMQEMLGGAIVGDTRAIGVFVITIHHAEDISAQDANGKSDPYVVLAYAKFGKPLYSTRIILEDLNPVWEETCVLLVTMDEIKSDEDVSAMLWDSDARSADDLIGRVQIPVKQLMETPNKMFRRADSFKGFEDADSMPGKLHWSIGFFEKASLKKELERPMTPEEAKAAPAPTKTAPAMEMRPDDKAPNPAKTDIPPPPPELTKTRPDPEFPSGVLSIILHQVNNLERQDLTGASGDREGEAGQDTDAPSEASDNLPSGYGEIIVNDDMVYKTRVKQYTTNPYFEAGTEVFIRDFKNTVVRVVIRDSRLREADPILGVVSVRLAEVFAEASTVTQTYAITEGVGFGKANISFTFRGMKTSFGPNLLGWETGTLEVDDVSVEIDDEECKHIIGEKGTRLTIKTSDSIAMVPKKEADVIEGGKSIRWGLEGVRLPVYSRYSSSVVFELGSPGTLTKLVPMKKGEPDAIAVLWLQDLTDDIEQHVKIPIIVGQNLSNLRQNAINDQTAKHHDFKVVGWLETKLKLDSGLDEDHEALSDKVSQSRRHALEAYDRVEGEAEIAEKNAHANDDGVIDKDEKKAIEDAHKRQLVARGRGPAQIKAYRTGKWMKDGIKSRLLPKSSNSREPTVQTEA